MKAAAISAKKTSHATKLPLSLSWVRDRSAIRGKTFGVALAPAGLPREREEDLLTRLWLAQ